MAKLTPKQQRFVDEYLTDLNATQAAIRAGYNVKAANQIGNEIRNSPRVSEAIDKAMAERSKRTGITQERIVRELARIAFVNPVDVVDMDEAKLKENALEDDTAAIASVKVKTIPLPEGDGVEREIRFADKIRALELVGKHFGMFTDKLKVTGDLGVRIVDDIPGAADDQGE